MPQSHCMRRAESVMPAQQTAPKRRGLPPVLMSCTTSVFNPIAAIANTMKNFDRVLIGAK